MFACYFGVMFVVYGEIWDICLTRGIMSALGDESGASGSLVQTELREGGRGKERALS